MLLCSVFKQRVRALPASFPLFSPLASRGFHLDGRDRLSNFWTPCQSSNKPSPGNEDSHGLLIRAGFLRQAHSGIFHLLPLGLRVQDKIERLIGKHMLRLGAAKVSLSSLSSQELWRRSGRFDGRDSEFFRLEDRKQAKYLLSPTHEEEITAIVANAVHSYKDLPLRLYQVSRKYRDEARPRQGLLRGREFLMKDLYTFDVTEQQARDTYEDVRRAYSAFLDELRLPYLVATADSGNMGGKLSHEYHFASDRGEDTVISCERCDYLINEELYIGHYDQIQDGLQTSDKFQLWTGISKARDTLVQAYYPQDQELNMHAIKAIFPNIDTSIEDATSFLKANGHSPSNMKLAVYCDPRMGIDDSRTATVDGRPILLTKARHGDPCSRCEEGTLTLQRAVEIGHTFHLGTRYSEPLGARVINSENEQTPISMGCHGIGVSRIIGAAASLLADSKGLNWPLAIAPYGVMMIPTSAASAEDTNVLYDHLTSNGIDAAIDDRVRSTGWKLTDADLVGYPFILVLGKGWAAQPRTVELQCRRLGVKAQVPVAEVLTELGQYSSQL